LYELVDHDMVSVLKRRRFTMPVTRKNQDHAAVNDADQFMQSRRFAEAISLYETQLAIMPNDVATLLKLGICHLLNRSQQRFLDIYAQAQSLLAGLPVVPDEVSALWRKYEGLVVKVTAGVLVVGGLSLTGCGASSNQAVPGKPPESQAPAAGTGAAPSVEPPISSHRYSGGVYIRPIEIDKPNPLPATPPSSSHKYSGGVYLNPRPDAHESV
jgi:hypothetical protein